MNTQNADGFSAPRNIQAGNFAGLHDPQRLGGKAMLIDRDRIPAHDPVRRSAPTDRRPYAASGLRR